MNVLYVYALSDTPPRPRGRGLAGEPLRLIETRGLVVIAGEMEAAPAALPPLIRAHDVVVTRLGRRCPALLPARFGWTVAERDLRARLAPHHRDLRRALAEVRGCVQMTVRVFGDTPPEAAPRARRPRGPRAGTSYLRARAEAWREAESLPELEPLRRRLADLLRAERQQRHGAAGLVGTAYHLVERRRLGAYRARVRRAAPGLEPLRLHVSGPWAPYAFGPSTIS